MYIKNDKYKHFNIDWDKIKTHEDLKVLLSVIIDVKIDENHVNFNDLKNYLKEVK